MCIVEAEFPDLTIVYSFALDNFIAMMNNSEPHDYKSIRQGIEEIKWIFYILPSSLLTI